MPTDTNLPLPTESTCDGFLIQSQAQAALHTQWKNQQKEERVRAKMQELNSFFGEISSDQEEEEDKRNRAKKRRHNENENTSIRTESRTGHSSHGGLGAFFKRSFGRFKRSSPSSHVHSISTTSTTSSSSSSSDYQTPTLPLSLHHNTSIDIDSTTIQKFIQGDKAPHI